MAGGRRPAGVMVKWPLRGAGGGRMPSDMAPETRKLRRALARLSGVEERRAAAAVRRHLGPGARYRIVDVSLAIDKPPDPREAPPRRLRALVADYGGNRQLDFVLAASGEV